MSPFAAAGRIPALRPRDRRALLIGAAIVVPALAWGLVVRPYRDALEEARDRRRAEEGLLVRERDLVRRIAALPPGDTLVAPDARLFAGSDADAAGAGVAAHVAEVAATAGVRLLETEAVPSEDTLPDVLEPLPLRMRASGSLESVLALLVALRTSDRVVHVTELALDAASGGAPGALGMTATLRGYRGPGPANAAPVALAGGPEGRRASSADAEAIVAEVAALAPFSATRRDEAVEALEAPETFDAPPPLPAPTLRVLGTVVGGPGGSFAVCQLDDDPPRVVRIGESIGGSRLVRVEPGAATFVRADGARAFIRLTDPGA